MAQTSLPPSESYTALVDGFLASNSPGNCLPGPYLPLGLVRLGPDTCYPHPTHGYKKGSPVVRFSHTHVAGTGGCSRYGNIAVTPFTNRPRVNGMPPFFSVPLQRTFDAVPDNESAELGLYACNFRPFDIGVELTTTRHVGIHRYRFPTPAHAGGHWLMLDAGAVIQTGLGEGGHHRLVEEWDPEGASIGGHLEVTSARSWCGRSDFQGGWGHDHPYAIYWWAEATVDASEQLLATDGGSVPEVKEGSFAVGKGARIALNFGGAPEVELRVGISFVSIANARAAVATEARGQSFESLVAAHRAEWARIFDRFEVKGGTETDRRLFYSFLYRLYCMPTDLGIDHENPHWKSGVRQFTDFYCLWDSIRNANSFFNLVDRPLARDIANCLIDIADHTGWMPDAHIANHHAYMQSACAADILFPEAQLKGIDGVDYQRALKHLRRNAEDVSPDIRVKGRFSEEHDRLGYLSTDVRKSSMSRHIEYGFYDWCIGRLAAALGEPTVAADYKKRSERIWNLWREDHRSFSPRRADGTWHEPFDSWATARESWNDPYSYEGPPAVWTLNAMHDVPGLVARMGGTEAFIKHLDRCHTDLHRGPVKETRMHLPHLYTCVGRPDLAALRVREALKHFTLGPDGLHDNEDAGCQSCFYLFNALGLYPFIGFDLYFLCPPRYDETLLRMPERGVLRLTRECRGGDAYITGATLNGKSVNRAWVRHHEIAFDAHLHFILGAEPTDWGTRELPPLSQQVDPTRPVMDTR